MGLVPSATVCCTGLNPEWQLGGRDSGRTTAACHGWERWVGLGMVGCLNGREIGRSVAGCRRLFTQQSAGCWLLGKVRVRGGERAREGVGGPGQGAVWCVVVVVWPEPACCAVLWSAVQCSVLLCVSCLLAGLGTTAPFFGSSSPSPPSPLLLLPSSSSALCSPALPHPITRGLPRANSISAVVTLLAFSLFGLWLAGPLGNQPKAPSPHPSKLQSRMPRARAPRFGFEGHRHTTSTVAPQHQGPGVPGTSGPIVVAAASVAAAAAAAPGCRRRKTRDLGRGCHCHCRGPRALLELGTQLSFLTGGSP